MDPHELSAKRSMALHKVVVSRCRADPSLYLRAKEVLNRWVLIKALDTRDAARWFELFDAGMEATLQAVLTEDEAGHALRSSSPFSVLLSARERWALWKKVRHENDITVHGVGCE